MLKEERQSSYRLKTIKQSKESPRKLESPHKYILNSSNSRKKYPSISSKVKDNKEIKVKDNKENKKKQDE